MATTAPPTAPPQRQTTNASGLTLGRAPATSGKRIGIYGPGGCGKTSLASLLPSSAFFDLDDSLNELGLKNDAVLGVGNWADMRKALQADIWSGTKNIIIDSATAAEEMAVKHTLDTVMASQDKKVFKANNIEDYGWGKGYQHVFDTFLCLLGDLDAHIRAGRNVVLIMHDCVTNVPNPSGDDYMRYEPRLQSPNSGKASIRLRVREWLGSLFCISYDVETKDGKGRGCGTRTIYPNEAPHCMAKSRSKSGSPTLQPLEFIKDDSALWNLLFQK